MIRDLGFFFTEGIFLLLFFFTIAGERERESKGGRAVALRCRGSKRESEQGRSGEILGILVWDSGGRD